jgi:hypothetical protein
VTQEREVWAYVAHRDGKWVGVIAGSLDLSGKEAEKWTREIAKFCGNEIASGGEITRVYSREEYEALVKGMEPWQRPKKAAAPRDPDTADLFRQEKGASSVP